MTYHKIDKTLVYFNGHFNNKPCLENATFSNDIGAHKVDSTIVLIVAHRTYLPANDYS